MDTRRFSHGPVSICFYFISLVILGLGLTACKWSNSLPLSQTPISSPSPSPEHPASLSTAILPPGPAPTPICTDNLAFISDLTIPDGTVVAPGDVLDKRWLVQNSGNCNWDTRYRLRRISGDAFGASNEQALFPARAGTQAILRIVFIAPQEAGEYISEWQAFDANGISFGESFFIKIEVQK